MKFLIRLHEEVSELPSLVDHKFIENTLTDLVQISSVNPPGSAIEIVEYLAQLSEKEGFSLWRQKVEQNMENIIIAPFDNALKGRKIALVGHLDTVPIGDNWTKDPLGKDRDRDILYGRGAADMKAGVTAFLAVLKKIKELEELPTVTPVFIGTADEEVRMRGSRKFLGNNDFQKPLDFVVIGEPTGLKLGIAEKGIFHVKMHTKGVAAHGSRPELGRNAIDISYSVFNQIRKKMPTKPDELLGPPTMNLGTLVGGTKINVVPDTCVAELDFRFGPSYTSDLIENVVQEACRIVESPCSIEHEVVHQLPALTTDQNHPFIQKVRNELENLGYKSIVSGLTFATDAAVLIPEWKVPFLIFGPGNQDVLHIANEWVSIKETIDAAQILTNAIISFN